MLNATFQPGLCSALRLSCTGRGTGRNVLGCVFLLGQLFACSEPAEEGSAVTGSSSGAPATGSTASSSAAPGSATGSASSGAAQTSTGAGSAAPSQSGAMPQPTPPSSAEPSGGPAPTSSGSVGGSASTASGGEGGAGPTASDSAGGSAGQPPVQSAGGAVAAGGAAEPSGQPAVRFVGRVDAAEPENAAFAWSGSGVVAAFEGTEVSVTLQDTANQFAVVIDGALQPEPLKAQSGSQTYLLASELSPGSHQVELYRRTEASFNPTRFLGFDFGPEGRLLAPPAPPARRIELVGDSISCGYGNEGLVATCSFSADTENHYASYGALAARALQAELSTVAWSGKGIVYNYDTDTNEPLPALYDRTLPSEASSAWDFSFVPHAVVINLGTNDFSTEGDPSPELFHDEYSQFLEHIRGKYPEAFILCTVGPMLNGADLDAARAGIAAAVQTRQAAGDELVDVWEMNISNNEPGCDYHPSLATHQAMGDALAEQLRSHLGW